MKKLVLATGNRNKVREIKDLLPGLPLEVQTLKDYPGLVLPEEDRSTFAGNAVKKAEAVSTATGELALADDSGLAVFMRWQGKLLLRCPQKKKTRSATAVRP